MRNACVSASIALLCFGCVDNADLSCQCTQSDFPFDRRRSLTWHGAELLRVYDRHLLRDTSYYTKNIDGSNGRDLAWVDRCCS